MTFQKRVLNWLMECFSNEVCRDGVERNHRFLEESLELVQSLGCTRSEAHQLVDYVFDRPAGEPMQELGGSMVTLSALASCHDMDMNEAGETELARGWTKIEKIRAKQLAKPKHSPLPEHVAGVAQQPPHDFAPPDGWQMVPVEPTKEMIQACIWALDLWREKFGNVQGFVPPGEKYQVRWKAMLAAAPNAPAVSSTERS